MLLGWTLLGGLDALNGVVRDAVLPRLARMAYQLALLAAFALIGGAARLAVRAVPHLPHRAALRLQPHDAGGCSLADLVKGALVGAVIGLPLAALILWLMGATGALWWLWAWAVWMGFNLLMLVLYPTVIAPLFNKFEPLPDETLKARVQALMQRCGFAAKGLFVMDGSRRSAHANAYFTGFGAAKRVVFFDTLLAKLDARRGGGGAGARARPLQAPHVHQAHGGDVRAQPGRLRAAGLAVGAVWFYTGLGVSPNLTAPNDALALLLFMLAVPVFAFFVSPLLAQLSRRHEFEADAYACAQASGSDLASALLKLYEDNASTLTPDPVYVRFYYSHPPAAERLAALRAIRHEHRLSPHSSCTTAAAATAATADRRRCGAAAQRWRHGWRVADGAIEKTLHLRQLPRDDRVRERAWLDRQHAEDHHPDLLVDYNRCTVRFNTHSVGGISINDFICAAKVDALLDVDAAADRSAAAGPRPGGGRHGRHFIVETPEGGSACSATRAARRASRRRRPRALAAPPATKA